MVSQEVVQFTEIAKTIEFTGIAPPVPVFRIPWVMQIA